MRLLQLAFVVALASGVGIILIYITGLSNFDGSFHLSSEDLEALQSLQTQFQKCVSANGLGLQAVKGKDNCEVSLKFPSNTAPKWKDPKTGELEGLSFDFNLCEAVATWEQLDSKVTFGNEPGSNDAFACYSSIVTVHPAIIDERPGTKVIESSVVDEPQGNIKDETCYFVEAFKSLADVSELLAL